MILSSPFSRQNRNHQSWTNGAGSSPSQHSNNARKPPPKQPAPQQPKPQAPVNGSSKAAFRSHTLNRLDIQRSKTQQNQQQQQSIANKSSLQRNLSSLGNYPSHEYNTSQISNTLTNNYKPSQIYAPASIASPSELAYYKRQQVVANGDSQHYAATSYRETHLTAPSDSGRSGRESALGNLLERFGTLRRRAKWSRSSSSRKATSATTDMATPGVTISNGGPGPVMPPPLPPPPPSSFDPEIYGSGKKKIEAEEIYAEGMRAIDGNIQKRLLQYELNESIMNEGETRTIIEEESKQQPDYKELVDVLTNWINDELSHQRIIVKDLQDDLYDGQILGKLIEKLHLITIDIVEVTQNEATQRYKLRTVLDTINRILSLQARWARIRWSVEGIHGKNMVEIIQLLVTLALYYRAPIKLEPNVRVRVLVVQKLQGQLIKRSHEAQLTDSSGSPDGAGPNGTDNERNKTSQRDAFDSLIEFAPDKLAIVKQSFVNFVNRHLNKINMSCLANNKVHEVLDPEQFTDGLLFVFLIASLEDYFVPLGNLFTLSIVKQKATSYLELPQRLPDLNNNNGVSILQTALQPTSYINTQPIHKLHNVNVAFQLMEEAGIAIRERVRAEDIVNGDLKSVLRVLYALFSRYKHI